MKSTLALASGVLFIITSQIVGANDGATVQKRRARRTRAASATQTRNTASVAPTPERKQTNTAVAPDKNAEAVKVSELNEASLAKVLRQEGAKARTPLLVNFWATWCDPCREEFPDLVKIDDDYRPRGLEFITISLDDVAEINTTVPAFLKLMRATRAPAYLLNADDPEAAILGVDKDWRGELPATFLFDRTGQLVFQHKGRIKPAELRAALDKTLDAK
ncbi:MAG TPA: redoxin domain-containing protein [Pyrinomonadaceae bacterium]